MRLLNTMETIEIVGVVALFTAAGVSLAAIRSVISLRIEFEKRERALHLDIERMRARINQLEEALTTALRLIQTSAPKNDVNQQGRVNAFSHNFTAESVSGGDMTRREKK